MACVAESNRQIAGYILDAAARIEFKCRDENAERGIQVTASFERDHDDRSAETPSPVWMASPERRAALVVAHPAHEIRVLQWLSQTRAHTYVLTQGSRSSAETSRRQASEDLISSVGGTMSGWGGIWDRDLYKCLLNGAVAPFERWTSELADDLAGREVDLVVADAWQFYNVAHDLTHLMARLATARASAVLRRPIAFFDYPVVPDEMAPGVAAQRAVATLRLNEAEAMSKRAAAAAIADIAGDATDIEAVEGNHAFARESFREPPALQTLLQTPCETPLYERFGEQRVQSNIYFDVIRWGHVRTICEALVASYGSN